MSKFAVEWCALTDEVIATPAAVNNNTRKALIRASPLRQLLCVNYSASTCSAPLLRIASRQVCGNRLQLIVRQFGACESRHAHDAGTHHPHDELGIQIPALRQKRLLGTQTPLQH